MKKLRFYLQFDGFGIADCDWEKLAERKLPMLMLRDEDYGVIGCKKPNASAPYIGVLMGRDPDFYSLQKDYVIALTKSGANILFLDYRFYDVQLSFCHGLLLPGGSFESPEWYYSDAKSGETGYTNERSKAYAECLHYAKSHKMPVLGICAGMQTIAAESGFKLYRSTEHFNTSLLHKTSESPAHNVQLVVDTPFFQLMGKERIFAVNSRHKEYVAPVKAQLELNRLSSANELPLEVYAIATDTILEAIGNMEAGILGIQWHPENLAAQGDKVQQRIFDWLVKKATEYQLSKS